MTRAEKFIKDSGVSLWQFWDVSGRFIQDKDLSDLLEQFLKESLPTDEEILSYFGEKNDKASCNKREGAKWATDFVREEKDEDKCGSCMYLNNPIPHNRNCNVCNRCMNYSHWEAKKQPDTKKEEEKVGLTCCGCGKPIITFPMEWHNKFPFHNESCIERMKHQGEFMFGKPKAVDYKVSPTEKKEPTLEDEINALKEPTVENATTHDLLTELIKRNLK
jgi:hypothetical protein